MDHVIGAAVRGVSKSIAVVSEVASGQRRNSAESKHSEDSNNSDSEDDIWSREQDLDDVVDDEKFDHQKPEEQSTETYSSQDVANNFILQHEKALGLPASIQPIPQSVILPQRRPRQRSRGFIRAYPPILGECSGIDQDMFMAFLTDFDKAAKAWPIFDVINLAAFGIGLVPHAPFMAASTAMQFTATVGKELQTRYQTNQYLEKINNSLFKPRKLYALIMTYRPDMPNDAVLCADITNPQSIALSKAIERDSGNVISKTLSRFRNASSGTSTDAQMPEPAPLIYPALDQYLLEGKHQAAITSDSTEQSLSSSSLQRVKSPSKAAIVQDYLDRRAQAQFIASNPNSKLASTLPPQQKKFVNRFADPDHPVNSGSVFGLVTGGNWDPIASGRVRRAEKKARKKGEESLTAEEKHDAYMGRKVRGRVTGTPSKNTLGLRKMFAGSVLYLVITNLPEQAE